MIIDIEITIKETQFGRLKDTFTFHAKIIMRQGLICWDANLQNLTLTCLKILLYKKALISLNKCAN